MPSLPEHVLKNLIELCVQDNIFVFNGRVYCQTDGVAMGNALGPILANIFMAHLEETKIASCPHFPEYYRRYVDDTFYLFKNRDDAAKFFEYINSLHPSIKFDMESEVGGKLEFLDTVISRATHSTAPRISTKIKKTDKGLFYHFSSFIRERYKINLISTLVYRIYQIASDMSIFHMDVTSLKRRLMLNGFPSYLVDMCLEKVLNRYHAGQHISPVNPGVQQRELVIALPFLGPLSLVITIRRRLLRLV